MNKINTRINQNCPHLINININTDKEVFEICPLLKNNTHIQTIKAKGEKLSDAAIILLTNTIKYKNIRLSLVKNFNTIGMGDFRYHFPS